MNTPQPRTTLPAIGEAFEGGFYAGQIRIDEQAFALVVAPKFDGEHNDTRWANDYQDVPGAKSYADGLTNTAAMAEAGSELAQWARGLRIGGFDDWYLPALDELELCYRNLKPTADTNSCWARSGINQAALPPTAPYTPEFPMQTSAPTFTQGEGEAEAFDADWYWTSTQHASDSDYAWFQVFAGGSQNCSRKDDRCRARAVRRVAI